MSLDDYQVDPPARDVDDIGAACRWCGAPANAACEWACPRVVEMRLAASVKRLGKLEELGATEGLLARERTVHTKLDAALTAMRCTHCDGTDQDCTECEGTGYPVIK